MVAEEDALTTGGAGEAVQPKLLDARLDLDAVGVAALDAVVDTLDADVLDLHVAAGRDPDTVDHIGAVDQQPLQVDRPRGIAEADLDAMLS